MNEAYSNYFGVVKGNCKTIQHFFEKNNVKKKLTKKEQTTFKNYLKALVKHYEELSEIDFEGHPQAEVIQDLVFEEKEVASLIQQILNVKQDMEMCMEKFGLLPDDYDNGLI